DVHESMHESLSTTSGTFTDVDVMELDEDAIIDEFLRRFARDELNGLDEHSIVSFNLEEMQEEPFQQDEAQDKETTYENELQDEDVYEDCMDEVFCASNSFEIDADDFQGHELQDDAICGSWITVKGFQSSKEGPSESTMA
ncbi:hypothetical protein L7F22_027854, partial [Adiantum nelumboides]|nr:hypothetical protein [Adiantum nelumboides]